MMPIRSDIVNTNIFHYFKRKIALFDEKSKHFQNRNIFKIKRDGLQPIKLLLLKELLYN